MPSIRQILLFFQRRILFFTAVSYYLWLALLCITVGFTTYFLQQAVAQRDFPQISKFSTQTQTALRLLDFSTASIIPDLGFAHYTVTLVADNYPLLFWLDQLNADPFLPTESPLSSKIITELSQKLELIPELCQKTWFIQHLSDGKICQKIETVVNFQQSFAPFIVKHLEQDHTYIILFQNSEELRASGGFMGSFAKIVVGAQGLSYLEIQDIYEPDGQFTGFVPAPPGVAEYLSSGNGLRLPDANWAADFPSAAQTILSYFSFGNHQAIDGIIAINSSLIEKLLQITGDIYLPDYDTNVSATTFSNLARANRDEFFPGSKQKQHFLSSFMTQLKLRLTQLSPSQQNALIKLLEASFASKDVLMYSTDPELQAVLEKNQVTGSLTQDTQPNFIYLLESNVGINKANKLVNRQVRVTITEPSIELHLTIKNQNTNLDYANYQRIIVPTGWQLQQLSLNGIPTTSWSETTHTPNPNSSYKELGFLVGVPANQESNIIAKIISSNQPSLLDSKGLTIIKQPGLPATPYEVIWLGKTNTFLLDQDTQLPVPL